MSTIHFKATSSSTPEQFVAGLTDFGPGRGKLFGNSTDDYLKVHSQGRDEADVTGGGGVYTGRRGAEGSLNRLLVVLGLNGANGMKGTSRWFLEMSVPRP